MTVVSKVFESLGRREAEYFDIPNLPMVVVPHPWASKSDEEMRRIVTELVPEIVAALTGRDASR